MKALLQPGKSFGSAANSATAQRKGGLKTLVDNRPTMVAQRKLQEAHTVQLVTKRQVIQRVVETKIDRIIDDMVLAKRIENQYFGAANCGYAIVAFPDGTSRTYHAVSEHNSKHTEEALYDEIAKNHGNIFKNDPNDPNLIRITKLYTERKPCESTNADSERRKRKDTDSNCHNFVERMFHADMPVYYSVENSPREHAQVQDQAKTIDFCYKIEKHLFEGKELSAKEVEKWKPQANRAIEKVCSRFKLERSHYRDYIAEAELIKVIEEEAYAYGGLTDYYRSKQGEYIEATLGRVSFKMPLKTHTSVVQGHLNKVRNNLALMKAELEHKKDTQRCDSKLSKLILDLNRFVDAENQQKVIDSFDKTLIQKLSEIYTPGTITKDTLEKTQQAIVREKTRVLNIATGKKQKV